MKVSKSHIKIFAEPPRTIYESEVSLCGAIVAHPVADVIAEGEIKNLKEFVKAARGLCRQCVRQYLERADQPGKEWTYFIAEGSGVEARVEQ